MCLQVVSEKLTPTTMIQSGWKEFNKTGWTSKKLSFAAYSYRGSMTVPLDKWITAEGEKLDYGNAYKPGFHIYEDEKELTKNTNKHRVYYRNVHTRGRQDGKTVVIAQEMFVPSNPDDWPPKD